MMVHQILLFQIMWSIILDGLLCFSIMVQIILSSIMSLHARLYFHHHMLVILGHMVMFMFKSPKIIHHGHLHEILSTIHFKEQPMLRTQQYQMSLHHLAAMFISIHTPGQSLRMPSNHRIFVESGGFVAAFRRKRLFLSRI